MTSVTYDCDEHHIPGFVPPAVPLLYDVPEADTYWGYSLSTREDRILRNNPTKLCFLLLFQVHCSAFIIPVLAAFAH